MIRGKKMQIIAVLFEKNSAPYPRGSCPVENWVNLSDSGLGCGAEQDLHFLNFFFLKTFFFASSKVF